MIVEISKQIIIMMRGESLSDTDSACPRLEQLVPVYGGSQWSSDWIPGVKFPKQIINIKRSLVRYVGGFVSLDDLQNFSGYSYQLVVINSHSYHYVVVQLLYTPTNSNLFQSTGGHKGPATGSPV